MRLCAGSVKSSGDVGPEIRPIPAGDEIWVAIVNHVASTFDTVASLEARLRQRYPNAVVQASALEGLKRPIWYVYRRRWFERRR